MLCFALVALSLSAYGCVQESESKYIVTEEAGETAFGDFVPSESETAIGVIVNEWRAFSIIFVLISVGLIALMYPLSSALKMPSLKAWADVELAEAFSTVLIVVFIMTILVFVEVVTHGLIAGIPEFTCDVDTDRFCPITVANQYLQEYLEKSLAVYDDIFETAIKKGKMATMSVVVGTNYLFLGYLSLSMKLFPDYMIEVTTATQEMQFLMGMRDALLFQQFILNHVSGTLAPMALMLGIIFRSFFITRKMGGLLMAFGIGFLLVFPATYALAMYTVHTTLYGTTTTGGDIDNQFCTASCMQRSPQAYSTAGGTKTYQRSEIKELFPPEGCSGGFLCRDGDCASSVASDASVCNPDEEFVDGFCIDPSQSCETDDEYKERIDDFILGQECSITIVSLPMSDPLEIETCEPFYSEVSPETGKTIYFCGAYDEKCPPSCRTLPYSNTNPECASRETEYYCRETVPEECFIIRFANLNDPILAGLSEEDKDACPFKCRPLVGLKKEGCVDMSGYGFSYSEEDTVEDVDEQMDADGYPDTLSGACAAKLPIFLKTFYCGPDEDASRALAVLGFKGLDDAESIAWQEGCPNNCRWVTTDGELGTGCSKSVCGDRPVAPGTLWQTAKLAADPDNYDLETQIAAAEESCYTIIPADVFTDTDCLSCAYLMDPGFASYPPVHQRCDSLCGKAKKVAVSSDSGDMETGIDGFAGPLEMKTITKLVVPAVILPLLNLVITFIFIRTLSPMLGGDVDIPGMMRMIR